MNTVQAITALTAQGALLSGNVRRPSPTYVCSNLYREMSFSIGRPDTLGADIYHNRRFPLVRLSTEADVADSANSEMLEPPYCAIIGRMVNLVSRGPDTKWLICLSAVVCQCQSNCARAQVSAFTPIFPPR